MEKLSVFGLGKLGCTMLACFAHKGWQVIGVDVSFNTVDKLNAGEAPIYEPGVDALIKAHRNNIQATMDGVQATLDSDVSFIIVPTLSNKEGAFSTRYVEEALKPIGEALKQKSTYHLVIVTSTVMPGDTERMAGLLEDMSGKMLNVDFGVCYNPDFIALGKVIHDFLNPDMVLIGESDRKAGDILDAIHSRLADNVPSIHHMSLHNAELAKIGLNAYCTMKITFANVIGEICEGLPEGDADKVLNAIGADSRVGKKYLRPGLAFSGPCFPRDCKAFILAANRARVFDTLASKVDLVNRYQAHRIAPILQKILHEKKTNSIAFLGATYKENVPILDESASLVAIKDLSQMGVEVRVYDPGVGDAGREEIRQLKNVTLSNSIEECLSGMVVCFVGVPWKEFTGLADKFILLMGEDPVIFDACGIYAQELGRSSFIDYRRIGHLNVAISEFLPGLE